MFCRRKAGRQGFATPTPWFALACLRSLKFCRAYAVSPRNAPANIASSTDSLLLNGMTRVGGACALSSRLTQSVRSKFLLVVHACRLMEGIYEAHMALMHVITDQRSSSILPLAPAFKNFGARSSQHSNLGCYLQVAPDVSRTRFIADHLQDLLLVYCITAAIYSLANIVSFLTTCTMQSYFDSPTIE
jgi:hypothetical protein